MNKKYQRLMTGMLLLASALPAAAHCDGTSHDDWPFPDFSWPTLIAIAGVAVVYFVTKKRRES
ncbi:hypothetical protein [Persicirhabdus sediminis]|nr:hypothetical protein [Persicirhabdus sediminis]